MNAPTRLASNIPMTMQFIGACTNYASIVKRINELLEFDHTAFSQTDDHPMSHHLLNIVHWISIGDIDRAEQEILWFEMLVNNLKRVKENTVNYLPKFRRKFSSLRDEANYLGWCEEVRIAGILCNKGIDFVYGDRPDFNLKYEGKSLIIDATSKHIVVEKNDLFQKFIEPIEDKSSSEIIYRSYSTLIICDMTHVIYSAQNRNISINPQMIRELVKETLDSQIIGAIVYSSWGYYEDSKTMKSEWIRCDSSNISKELKMFLDQYYKWVCIER